MNDFAVKIAEAVALSRVHAESLMLDRVRVWRTPDGAPVEDGWGHVTPPEPSIVHEGAAKAQNDRTYPGQVDVGGVARLPALGSHVDFPHGTTETRGRAAVAW